MNAKVKSVLDDVVRRFKDGDVPEAIAYSMFPIPDIPSAKWSMLNQLIQFFSGTKDARGYLQWKKALRQVRKGAKAIYILVPYFKKEEDEEEKKLVGFMPKAVFRVEDTFGEDLDYENLKLPELPLMERAKEWGIKVIPASGNYDYNGYYAPTKKTIVLATPEEKTFFHELAHAADEKLNGELKNGQDAVQEIVAELSAQVLCQLVGRTADKHLGNSYRYVESYATELVCSPYKAVLIVLSRVGKVLDLIIGRDYVLTENQS